MFTEAVKASMHRNAGLKCAVLKRADGAMRRVYIPCKPGSVAELFAFLTTAQYKRVIQWSNGETITLA